MGLGESAAASATVVGLLVLGGSVLVVLVILTLVIRSISGRWRSSLPLWATVLAVLVLIVSADFWSAGKVEKRRAEAIRKDTSSQIGHLVERGWTSSTEWRQRCPNGQGQGWASQASGRLVIDDTAAMDELTRVLAAQGFAVIGPGATPLPAQTPHFIRRSGEASVIVRLRPESQARDFLIVESEAGCLEWPEDR